MAKYIQFLDGIHSDYLQAVQDFVQEWESTSDHIIVQTSGSTGTPKKIELLKSEMERSARRTGEFFGFQKGNTVLLNLSPEFIAGKMMIVRAMVYEMNLIVAPLSSNPLLDLKDWEGAIHFGAFVPNQISSIMKDAVSREVYERIDQVIIGGARLNPDLIHELSRLSNRSFATFGMTETITHFALADLSVDDPFYTCLPGFSLGVDSESRLIVEDIDSKNTYETNDVVELNDSNSFRWLGRADYVVNSGGIKIFPEEVEKAFYGLIENRFYVTSKVHPKWGESVVLVVEGDSFSEKDQQYQETIKELPAYHRPKEIISIPKFEETKNGKVIRKRF